MSESNSSTYAGLTQEIIEEYRAKGWKILTALPAGEKKPPLTRATGAKTYRHRLAATAAFEWENYHNIGLVLATDDNADFDVIAIDIDDYGDKQGADNLAALMEELGDLNLESIPRSTRRGVKSRSFQTFWKVPKGKSWAKGACADVDVIQPNHRYSVVYPSIAEQQQYRWFLGDEETAIPSVNDLPWLPESWLEHLLIGEAEEVATKAPERAYSEAMDWLKDRVLDGEAQPVTITRDKGSRHHDMISKMHGLVQGAVFDGEPGLIASLAELEKRFQEAKPEAKDTDFSRALVGEVAKVEGTIAQGAPDVNWKEYAKELGDLEALAMPDFAQWVGLKDPVEIALSQSMKITGLIGAFYSLHPELLAYTSDKQGEPNVIVFAETQKELTRARLRQLLSVELAPLFDLAQAKIPADVDKDSYEYERRKAIGQLKALLEGQVTNSNLDNFHDLLVEKLKDEGKSMPKARLNTAAHLIGVGNEVLDFELAIENPNGSLKDWLRPREVEDYVTYSVPGDIRKGIAELEDGTKTVSENFLSTALNNKGVYEFTQAALGYSIYGSNSHQKVFVFYGHGGGGKTSLFKSMAATLGEDYVSTIKLSQLARAQTDKADPVYRQSLLTRVTFVDETDRGDRLNAGVIKSATESRSGRSLYSNDAVASDSNTIVFMTNNVFHFEHDSGIARRLAVIPLEAHRSAVRDSMGSPHLQWRERDSERAFMLQWLVRGYVKAIDKESILYTENYPKAIDKATNEFVKAADPSQEFFSRLEYTGNEEDFLSSSEMFAEFRNEVRDLTITSRSFAMKVSAWMKDIGRADTKINTGSVRGYRGWKYNKD